MPSDKDKSNVIDDCQLQVLTVGTSEVTSANRMRSLALRLISATERRLDRFRERLGQPKGPTGDSDKSGIAANESGGAFNSGDVVEVLTLEEVKKTLDESGNCDGLHFMAGMEVYCGRRFVVRKRVRTMFDERSWRMVRIRNAYILDGVICEARGMYEREGCDRCCFFFWKDRWLKRVTEA